MKNECMNEWAVLKFCFRWYCLISFCIVFFYFVLISADVIAHSALRNYSLYSGFIVVATRSFVLYRMDFNVYIYRLIASAGCKEVKLSQSVNLLDSLIKILSIFFFSMSFVCLIDVALISFIFYVQVKLKSHLNWMISKNQPKRR